MFSLPWCLGRHERLDVLGTKAIVPSEGANGLQLPGAHPVDDGTLGNTELAGNFAGPEEPVRLGCGTGHAFHLADARSSALSSTATSRSVRGPLSSGQVGGGRAGQHVHRHGPGHGVTKGVVTAGSLGRGYVAGRLQLRLVPVRHGRRSAVMGRQPDFLGLGDYRS